MATSKTIRPPRSIAVIDGIALLVGVVVGIGIFKAPQIVAANTENEWAFLGLWLLGGGITLLGALVYAELGATYPNSGGEFHFLKRALGQRVALLFAWARTTVIQPGAIAAVAFVFAEYAQQLHSLGAWGPLFYASASIIALTTLNLLGSAPTRGAQVLLTVLTIGAIGLVVFAALTRSEEVTQLATHTTSGSVNAAGLALIFVLLTYGGWNESAYISAEMKNVGQNMVRVLVGGTVIIVLIYFLMNLAMLKTLGIQGMSESDAVAADVMRQVAGDSGATLLSLIICIAALSTLNATIFTGARLYFAVGRELRAFKRLAVWHEKGNKPTVALVCQSTISLGLVILGSLAQDGFTAMVEYTAPVFWMFLLLIGISFFVLRCREPAQPRPFTVPAYPFVPIAFCLTCAYLLYSSLAYTGYGALFGAAVLVAGMPLLFMQRNDARLAAAE